MFVVVIFVLIDFVFSHKYSSINCLICHLVIIQNSHTRIKIPSVSVLRSHNEQTIFDIY
jgi:hypothetical protein